MYKQLPTEKFWTSKICIPMGTTFRLLGGAHSGSMGAKARSYVKNQSFRKEAISLSFLTVFFQK